MEIITEWPILTEELKKVILRGKNPEEYEIYPVAFRRKPTDIGYVAVAKDPYIIPRDQVQND